MSESAEEQAVKDPLVVASAAVIAGVYYGPPSYLWLSLAVAVLAALSVIVQRFAQGRTSMLFIAIAGFFFGLSAVALRVPNPPELLELAGKTVVLRGEIVEVPDRNTYGQTVIVALSAIGTSTRAEVTPIEGRVRLTVSGGHLPYGAQILAIAALQPPEARLIPAFRARGLAVRRGVVLTGGAKARDVVVQVEPSPIRAHVARWISDPTLAAIALADRSLSDPAREERLVFGGESFVFALAGATMALLVLGLYAASDRRPRIAAIPALLLTAALITAQGATPSALRTGATLIVLILWSAILRRIELRRALPLAIILVLLIDPAAIGDPFYQLSVASITACVTVYPAFAEHVPWRRVKPLVLLAAVAFATAPLITRQFERITVLSLFANMLTLPLATAIAALPFSEHLLAALELLRVPPAMSLATPTVLECALFYTAMFAFAAKPQTRRTRGAALLSLIALLVIATGSRLDKKPQIAVLPGGFVVVEDKDRGVLIYGTGEPQADPEAGTRILDLYLKKRRITEVASLVLPAPTTEVAAIQRQRELLEVRYARDPLEEVRARLGTRVQIEPGFTVIAGDRRYFSWKDGLITIRERDGVLVAEPHLR